VQLIKYD